MTDYTRQAIRQSLLEQKPINKVTVKDIVEDCGINRNSFYYHYADIPTLVEEIIVDEAEKIIKGYSSIDTLSDCIDVTVAALMEHRRAVLHIHNSPHRELYEQYLWKICGHLTGAYFDTALQGDELDPEQKRILQSYHKCAASGLIINWLNGGMKEDLRSDFRRLIKLRHELNQGKYKDIF